MDGENRDFFKEYFEKMQEIQEELENGEGDIYKGGYKSIHAGQALLYDMAASAAVKAKAAKEAADQNKDTLDDAIGYGKIVAAVVAIISFIHLPEIIIWLQANWPF